MNLHRLLIVQRALVVISAWLFFTLVSTSLVAAVLPDSWRSALKKAKVPENAISVYVQELGSDKPLLAHRSDVPMNPASVMKVVTTTAALDLLGADFRWRTEVYLDGPLSADGTVNGNLILKGYGDPKITVERWQEFMQMLVDHGIRKITGNLLLDRTLFALPPHNPAEFDGSPLKPYNVGPDPLLVSFKSVRFQLSPPADPKTKFADVLVDPPLAAVQITKLPKFTKRRCGDWWLSVRPRFNDKGNQTKVRFDGRYASGCGVQEHYAAVLNVPTFVHGMFTYYFREAGGEFNGKVDEVVVKPTQKPVLTYYSLPLNEIVFDVNKRSNNVMAQQVFLTLPSASVRPPFAQNTSRNVIETWVKARQLQLDGLYVENGAGLSRHARVTADGLANLLRFAERSNWFPAFFESLPIAGVDGTLKRRFARSPAKNLAYLKSGYLNNVRSLAGYVDDINGKRYILVVMLNHKRAKGAGPVLEKIVNDVTQARIRNQMAGIR